MLDDVKRLFRKSWDAFVEEVSRREPEDEVAELLGAMRREMVDARALIKETDAAIEKLRPQLERERAEVEKCERRAEMAARIGDEETQRVADEFAARHRERVGVLEQKLEALQAERRMRAAEADEMMQQYKAAEKDRFALLARLRRVRAGESMRTGESPDDPFSRFEEMEDRVESESGYADALGDLDDAEPPPPRPPDVDDRLAELKRRMGK